MERLINLSTIGIGERNPNAFNDPERAHGWNDLLKILEAAPAVDAVEVVRCRDCKWYMPGDLFTDIMFCHRLKKDNGKPAKYNYCADDFCSYGERKDGDGNG